MRWIFAIGLAALLWASSVRALPGQSHAILSTAAADACAVAGESPDDGSHQQWAAAQHAIAVVTESVWKSAPVHAGLGSTPASRIFGLARSVSLAAPSSSTPLYLRHTPLLI